MDPHTSTPRSGSSQRPRKGVKAAARATALVTSITGAAVVYGAATAPAASAACNGGAREHNVRTMRGDHVLHGGGTATNDSATTERWCDLLTEEYLVNPATVFWPSVCDYQGQIAVYNPDGSATNRVSTSSYHSGCSWAGWSYHDQLDGTYAENKRFTTKWKSGATSGNWQVIGTLVD